jgi:hypothetical protein
MNVTLLLLSRLQEKLVAELTVSERRRMNVTLLLLSRLQEKLVAELSV